MELEGKMFVKACLLTKARLCYECPNCFTSYKRDGTPKKTAKKAIHTHGNNGNMENRVESRASHCLSNRRPVFIIIDETTQKQ